MAEVSILKSVPYLLTVPSRKTWTDYDEETDTLYISFYKPQRANDTILEDNILYHYRDDELVGLTILRAAVTFGITSQKNSE